MAIAAMKAGKDVHVEKPLGISLAEDLACREVVKRYNRVFLYGAESRSVRGCRLGCEFVRNGGIGEIREIRVKVPDIPQHNPAGAPQAVPPELDWNLFLGPAPFRPYTTLPMGGRYPFPWYYIRDFCVGWINNWAGRPH